MQTLHGMNGTKWSLELHLFTSRVLSRPDRHGRLRKSIKQEVSGFFNLSFFCLPETIFVIFLLNQSVVSTTLGNFLTIRPFQHSSQLDKFNFKADLNLF